MKQMKTFSPLFIAALTATPKYQSHDTMEYSFSPLFIAALTATTDGVFQFETKHTHFQSAFHRGTHCYIIIRFGFSLLWLLSVRFSSRHSLLQVGRLANTRLFIFQSAFHRGTHCYEISIVTLAADKTLSVRFSSRHSLLHNGVEIIRKSKTSFSPLFIAALTATQKARAILRRKILSVRFSSRHSLLPIHLTA